MRNGVFTIGVVAAGSPLDEGLAVELTSLANALDLGVPFQVELHPQCTIRKGHFAGDDDARAQAFLDVANDPDVDALWFARGGYGACRLLDLVMPKLTNAARGKTYLGYSDAGSILAALYREGFPHVVHGPMPADLLRQGGEAAVERALRYMITGDAATLEPTLSAAPAAAFNMTILSKLLGTPYAPDLSGHVLMLEEVSEYMYAIDRLMFHITSNENVRNVNGIALGRCSDIPENDYPFEMTEEEVVQHWCNRAGIAYLGRADIGHDAENKVVPFGTRLVGV